MDVKKLLNDDESVPQRKPALTTKPLHCQLPPLPHSAKLDARPSPAHAYSSNNVTSRNADSPSSSHTSDSEPSPTLPPCLTRSNTSESPLLPSPSTPDFAPYPLRTESLSKQGLRLPDLPASRPRPSIATIRSFSTSSSSGRQSSMDSLPDTPQSSLVDVNFPPIQAQPYFNPGQELSNLDTQVFPNHSPNSATAPPKTQQKKNTYACPLAKQYGCNEFFTTSGHAARHAKKHTGKKDAICPECNKAFTRKDNMEQHRRTHSGVRSNSKSSTSNDESRQRKVMKIQQQQHKKPRTSSLATTSSSTSETLPNNGTVPQMAPTDGQPITPNTATAMEMAMLDPRLRDPTGANFGQAQGPFNAGMNGYPSFLTNQLPPQMQPNHPAFNAPMAQMARPQLHRSSYDETIQYRAPVPTDPSFNVGQSPEVQSPSLAPALDALALAASRQ